MDESLATQLEIMSESSNANKRQPTNSKELYDVTTDQLLFVDCIKKEEQETSDDMLIFVDNETIKLHPLATVVSPKGRQTLQNRDPIEIPRLKGNAVNKSRMPASRRVKTTTVTTSPTNGSSPVRKNIKTVRKRKTKPMKPTPNQRRVTVHRWPCDECEKSFPKECLLKIHQRNHTNYRPYQCSKCKLMFTRIENLTVHIRTHTNERPYACKICPSRFTQRCALARHVLFHTGERPYSCDVCHKRFADLGAQRKHVANTHLGEKNFPCPYCDKRLTEKGSLIRHIRTHTKEKPFMCDICEKRFSEAVVLRRHMSMHTGLKPWECDLCQKTFKSKASMSNHIKRHFGALEKIYKCERECGKMFVSVGNMKLHVRLVHDKLRPFGCDKCDFTSISRGQLENHRATHAQNWPHKCKVCRMTFSGVGYLKTHMRRKHPNKSKYEDDYQCAQCCKRYNSKKGVKRHILSKHP